LTALVFAHHDRNGILREDTIRFLNAAPRLYSSLVLVSTNLDPGAESRLPGQVRVIRRENHGYDFYSYREGLLDILEGQETGTVPSHLTLMNSSFLIFETGPFLDVLQRTFRKADRATSVTISLEIERHMQSYAMTLGAQILADHDVRHWWRSMVPIDVRQQVIDRYEIGFSRFLLQKGFSLHAAVPDGWRRRFRKVKNPTFGCYRDLFFRAGICKVQLLRENPYKQDLDEILGLIDAKPDWKQMVEQALA
jgi:rhamnosyltransferase